MEKLDWIKDLVRAEQQMEDSAMVDFSAGFDPDKALKDGTLNFLRSLKDTFIEYSSAFNEMRGLTIGGVKIYGISNTDADFMLFRNGHKLIFTSQRPGIIQIRINQPSGNFTPGAKVSSQPQESLTDVDKIEARWGAFGELIWTYRELHVNTDNMVRYYLSRFIKDSAK